MATARPHRDKDGDGNGDAKETSAVKHPTARSEQEEEEKEFLGEILGRRGRITMEESGTGDEDNTDDSKYVVGFKAQVEPPLPSGAAAAARSVIDGTDDAKDSAFAYANPHPIWAGT